MKGIREYIYADNAATTKLDPIALEAMLPFLKDDFGNPSGLYSFSRSAKKALQDAREIIAECIGATSEEIFFTSGGTESDNWALKAVQGERIVTSSVEHHAILNSCNTLKKSGMKIELLPVNICGTVAPDTLAEFVKSGDLVSIMLANNEIGSVNDILALTSVAKGCGVLFHTDAVQAVGHIPIDVRKLGVDMLSASAHKFNGPKGVGILFIRKGVQLGNFIDGGQQEFGHRAGTENVASIVGMATSLRHNCLNMASNTKKLSKMVRDFHDTIIGTISHAVFNGDPMNHLPGHISLSIPGVSGESMFHLLDLRGIAVSTGTACNSLSLEISHVLKAIELSPELSMGTIRISFGVNNSEGDALAVAGEIISIYRKLREK